MLIDILIIVGIVLGSLAALTMFCTFILPFLILIVGLVVEAGLGLFTKKTQKRQKKFLREQKSKRKSL